MAQPCIYLQAAFLTVNDALHLRLEECVDHTVASEERLALEFFAHHDNLPFEAEKIRVMRERKELFSKEKEPTKW